MATFQALIVGALGIGVLLVVWRSLASGVLPFGPNGLRGRLLVERTRHPIGWALLAAGYTAGGLALVIFALRLLAGTAVPLPLQ